MKITLNHPSLAALKKQTGASLIEVLITMIITAIALLGYAALHMRAQAEHRIGQYRITASDMVTDLADRVRANYRYSRDGTVVIALAPSASVPAATTNCMQNSCTPVAMWAYDLNQWATQMRLKLPESGVELTFIPDTNSGNGVLLTTGASEDIATHPVVRIHLAWKEPDIDATFLDPACASAPGLANLPGYRCARFDVVL